MSRKRDPTVSILSEFEDRIGGAVEGVFAGVFRSPVQPVELARSLAKAMDDGRTVGVGKVYAPLGYTVALSREDSDKFGAFTATLAGELATYLTDHARERGYHLTAAPHVSFVVHDDLKLGRFRVSSELAAPEPANVPVRANTAPAPTPGPTGGHAPAAPALFDAEAESNPRTPLGDEAFFDQEEPSGPVGDLATVTIGEDGHDVALSGETVMVGRLASAGVRLADANVSREHAVFVRAAGGWAIQDLGSTNGTLLNGHPVSRALLRHGDVVEIGVTRLTYHEPGR
jgi:hypothetical protein